MTKLTSKRTRMLDSCPTRGLNDKNLRSIVHISYVVQVSSETATSYAGEVPSACSRAGK